MTARSPRAAPILRACDSRVLAEFESSLASCLIVHKVTRRFTKRGYKSFVNLRVTLWTYLVNHPFRDVLVRVNPAIPQERPVRTLCVNLGEIAFGHQDRLSRTSSLCDDLSRRVGDEALSPEFDPAVRISFGPWFVTHTIRDRYVNPVGDGVRPLDRLPR